MSPIENTDLLAVTRPSGANAGTYKVPMSQVRPAASETLAGIVELATAAETTTGTDATRAVHPAGLKVELDKKVNKAGDTMSGNLTVPSLNGFTPPSAGTGTNGQALVTNGAAGATSWSQIGTAGLADGAVTAAKLTSGMVLKAQTMGPDPGLSSSSGALVHANIAAFNFTPVSANSRLIIFASFNARISNLASTNTQSTHQISEGTSLIGSALNHTAFSASGDIGLQTLGFLQASVSNTATLTRSFSVSHAVLNTSSAVTTGAIWMTIIEVAN